MAGRRSSRGLVPVFACIMFAFVAGGCAADDDGGGGQCAAVCGCVGDLAGAQAADDCYVQCGEISATAASPHDECVSTLNRNNLGACVSYCPADPPAGGGGSRDDDGRSRGGRAGGFGGGGRDGGAGGFGGGAGGSDDGGVTVTFCNNLELEGQSIELTLVVGGRELRAETAECTSCTSVRAAEDIELRHDGQVVLEGSVPFESGGAYVLSADIDDGPTVLYQSVEACGAGREAWLEAHSSQAPPENECNACMRAECADELQACGENASCGSLLECIGECDGSEACFQDCGRMWSQGVDDLLAIYHCRDDSCRVCQED